jgi:RHS repeat-associated protein
VSDFQYAGYYYHAASGLNLTLNRAYNTSLGRWINRDPGEQGGGADLNLYTYVNNNPISFVDPLGLQGQGFDGRFGQPRQPPPPPPPPPTPPPPPNYKDCNRKCKDGTPCKIVTKAASGSYCLCPEDPALNQHSPYFDIGLYDGYTASYGTPPGNEDEDVKKEKNLFDVLRNFKIQ